MILRSLYVLAALCYGGGGVQAYRSYRSQDPSQDRSAARWLLGGCLAQGLLLFLKGWGNGGPPLTDMDGILSALSFALTTALLMGRARTPVAILTSLFAPFLFLLALSALFSGMDPVPLMDKTRMTERLAIHIFLTFLGFSHFTMGFGVGIAFWVQEGQLKQHRLGGWALRLPALESLDRLTVFHIGSGLLFWLGGLAVGTLEAYEVWDRLPLNDPKIIGSFLVLVIYAAFFLLRWGLRMRGRRSMLLVMVGYLLALFTFVGVRVLLNAPHGF